MKTLLVSLVAGLAALGSSDAKTATTTNLRVTRQGTKADAYEAYVIEQPVCFPEGMRTEPMKTDKTMGMLESS